MSRIVLLIAVLCLAGCSTYTVKMQKGFDIERLKSSGNTYLLKMGEGNIQKATCASEYQHYFTLGIVPKECKLKIYIINSEDSNETYEANLLINSGWIKSDGWSSGAEHEAVNEVFRMVKSINSHNK